MSSNEELLERLYRAIQERDEARSALAKTTHLLETATQVADELRAADKALWVAATALCRDAELYSNDRDFSLVQTKLIDELWKMVKP